MGQAERRLSQETQAWRQQQRERRAELARRAQLPQDDPDVQRYRAEKARRAARQ